MAKIEYPVVSGKTAYECFTHTRLFDYRVWCRRDTMYTVNIIEHESPFPDAPKQVVAHESVLVCPSCYAAMGYHTNRVTNTGQPTIVDNTIDMFEDDENG